MELFLIRSCVESRGVMGKVNGFLSERKFLFIISAKTADLHYGE